jgi:hypothetical protein
MDRYYIPPTPGAPPPSSFGVTPGVWPYYVAYVVLMAVGYFLMLLLGIGLFVASPLLGRSPSSGSDDPIVGGIIMTIMGLPLCAAFVAAPFLPKAPWAWTYHLVLICLGMTSACCLPVTMPLLIYWLKPDVKAFFGRAGA